MLKTDLKPSLRGKARVRSRVEAPCLKLSRMPLLTGIIQLYKNVDDDILFYYQRYLCNIFSIVHIVKRTTNCKSSKTIRLLVLVRQFCVLIFILFLNFFNAIKIVTLVTSKPNNGWFSNHLKGTIVSC